jgi:glycosyltransferase involved in cell wall biosynthesis
VRILWQGSPTHYEDWYPLRDALGYLTRKYPQIEWVIWGVLYPWVMELIPADRYRFIKWVPYAQYKLRLATIGHDINLAPLEPTRFNLCRSAIKFYESSILQTPAATIAQKTGPYADEILDGQTGLLYENPAQFIDQVSELVENESKRLELARNARDWVVENRDAFKVVPKLIDYYRELRELKQEERPHPTEEEWLKIQEQMKEWRAEDEAKKLELEAAAREQVAAAAESAA